MRSGPTDDLVAYMHLHLPHVSSWHEPRGYPSSLALCILDSIWSIGVHYDHHVEPVLKRYRAIAEDAGRDPERDSPRDLSETIDDVGGPEQFANVVGSRHRTSPTNGILKADASNQAARLLRDSQIENGDDLRAWEVTIKPAWRRIRGQGSGLSWRYLLMLAGLDGIKPDRMIHRFVTAATGLVLTDDDAADLLCRVHDAWPEPRPTLRQLDHAIWRHVSGRARL